LLSSAILDINSALFILKSLHSFDYTRNILQIAMNVNTFYKKSIKIINFLHFITLFIIF